MEQAASDAAAVLVPAAGYNLGMGTAHIGHTADTAGHMVGIADRIDHTAGAFAAAKVPVVPFVVAPVVAAAAAKVPAVPSVVATAAAAVSVLVDTAQEGLAAFSAGSEGVQTSSHQARDGHVRVAGRVGGPASSAPPQVFPVEFSVPGSEDVAVGACHSPDRVAMAAFVVAVDESLAPSVPAHELAPEIPRLDMEEFAVGNAIVVVPSLETASNLVQAADTVSPEWATAAAIHAVGPDPFHREVVDSAAEVRADHGTVPGAVGPDPSPFFLRKMVPLAVQGIQVVPAFPLLYHVSPHIPLPLTPPPVRRQHPLAAVVPLLASLPPVPVPAAVLRFSLRRKQRKALNLLRGRVSSR